MLSVFTVRKKMRLKSCQPPLQVLILCRLLVPVVVKVKGVHQHHPKSQKRTHRMELDGQSSSHQSQAQSLSKASSQLELFKFPVSKRILEYSKKGKSLEEEDRKQLIRDCVTCLKAECGDHITKEQFKLASQIICNKVPVLKDIQPLNWPSDVEFDFTVSDLCSSVRG